MDARGSLCACGCKWIANNERSEDFWIVSLQSDLGTALMIHYDMDPKDPTTWLYLVDGQG